MYPLSIVLVSLILGYARQRSDSLLASILLHVGNNAFSAVVKP
jgi:membrane protease YdiL (CAAX protease family)